MNKVLTFIFLFTVFFISFLPVKDTDFGWHYRCGKEFFPDKTICLKNNFSYFLPDYQSAYPSLLYDIPLAFIYDRFGFVGLSFMGAVIMTLSAFIFLHLFPAGLWLKIASFYLILFLSSAVFALGLRSQIITYLFFLALLLILKKAKEKAKYLFVLPLLFFLWVNFHIGFFLGLIIFLFFIIELFIIEQRNTTILRSAVVIFLASFLATLINPFGIGVYWEILNHTTSPLNQMIAEWVSPPFWQRGLIISLTIIVLLAILKDKFFSLFSFLMLLLLAALAFAARRNLPFFYTGVFSAALNSLHLQHDPVKEAPFDNLLIPILISAIFFFAIVNTPKTVSFATSWEIYCSAGLSRYPCRAIKNYPQISGNVFNSYEWGGFLIWQKPNIKVFVDGRMPAWKDEEGKSPYQVFLQIIQTQPGWNEKLRRWRTDYLLLGPGTFLDLLLKKEAKKNGWSEKYRDDIAVIYKKI